MIIVFTVYICGWKMTTTPIFLTCGSCPLPNSLPQGACKARRVAVGRCWLWVFDAAPRGLLILQRWHLAEWGRVKTTRIVSVTADLQSTVGMQKKKHGQKLCRCRREHSPVTPAFSRSACTLCCWERRRAFNWAHSQIGLPYVRKRRPNFGFMVVAILPPNLRLPFQDFITGLARDISDRPLPFIPNDYKSI